MQGCQRYLFVCLFVCFFVCLFVEEELRCTVNGYKNKQLNQMFIAKGECCSILDIEEAQQ